MEFHTKKNLILPLVVMLSIPYTHSMDRTKSFLSNVFHVTRLNKLSGLTKYVPAWKDVRGTCASSASSLLTHGTQAKNIVFEAFKNNPGKSSLILLSTVGTISATGFIAALLWSKLHNRWAKKPVLPITNKDVTTAENNNQPNLGSVVVANTTTPTSTPKVTTALSITENPSIVSTIKVPQAEQPQQAQLNNGKMPETAEITTKTNDNPVTVATHLPQAVVVTTPSTATSNTTATTTTIEEGDLPTEVLQESTANISISEKLSRLLEINPNDANVNLIKKDVDSINIFRRLFDQLIENKDNAVIFSAISKQFTPLRQELLTNSDYCKICQIHVDNTYVNKLQDDYKTSFNKLSSLLSVSTAITWKNDTANKVRELEQEFANFNEQAYNLLSVLSNN